MSLISSNSHCSGAGNLHHGVFNPPARGYACASERRDQASAKPVDDGAERQWARRRRQQEETGPWHGRDGE